ncbi:hypothetical protein [Microbispora triticiradicis]|uniref:Transporter n=2 Tax=Microbispora TaxID=2005 RepID=A0ABY3M3Y1_9ACTN|nr:MULTISPECIES: hypothetical protein [Microbispora]TLP62170.1 hypothetical protein FED44_09375 [Microbispora fusca]TYB66278.1 hypothetical protein FXF59_04775 [Microbispora tritici]
MTWLFVRMKLSLVRGSLRGELARQLGFVFSLLAAVLMAVAGFGLFALVRLAPHDIALDVVPVAFAMFAAGWIVVPLMAFGLDETLDPARLALFPLTTRQLATGLFAASVAGPWPIASLVALSGGVVALAHGPGGVLLGVPAVVLQFAFCIVISRLVTTALSSALRTRRGRDVLAVAAVFGVLFAQLPNLLLNQRLAADPAGLLASAADVLRWTPPGLAAHAIADGGLAGVADLVVVAVTVVVLGWLWITALRHALVRPDSSNQGGGSVRRSWAGGLLPGGMIGAVVAKELKYARREPRGRVNWIIAIFVSAVVMFSLHGPGVSAGPTSAIGPACLAALVIGLQSANSFGIDGRSLWMNAVAFGTPRDLRTDLAGRHLAMAVIAVPLLALASLAAALVAGDATWAPAAALTAWGVLGVGMGVGALTSVTVPYTYPDRLNAFSGAAPGQGGQAFVSSFATMLAVAALALPVALPVLLGTTWVAVLAVPYGVAVAWAGRRLASGIGFARFPELLAAVSRPT